MKILIIADYGEFGGTLTFLKQILKVCKLKNIRPAILITENQEGHEIIDGFIKQGGKVFIGPVRKSIFFRRYFSIIFDIYYIFFAFLKTRPDILLVTIGTPGMMLGSLFFPVPVRFVLHTVPYFKQKFVVRLLWRLSSQLQKNSFLAPSDFAAQKFIENLSIDRRKIKIIHNSYRSEFVEPKELKNPAYVLTIGHITEYKNPYTWLKTIQLVVRENPKVKFIWLGNGDLYNKLQENINTLGLEKNATLPGFDENVAKYYKKSSIYFQPSKIESHGIAVVDAMSLGIPCVSSNAGGLPESNIDGITGWVCDVDDHKSYASKILTLWHDPGMRKKFGLAGKKRTQKLFNPELHIKKLTNFIFE